MPWKVEEGGAFAAQDGMPVFVKDDGTEIPVDFDATTKALGEARGDAGKYRTKLREAESALSKFEGIEDPAAALDALEKVKSFSDKDMIEAGKVEEIKAAAIRSVEDRYKPIVEERDALQNEIRAEKIGGSFARSQYIADKLAVPASMVEATFGRHFQVEDGGIVAKDANGNPIYSDQNPGSLASFDEALAKIVSAYPHRDQILKGTGANGSGAKPGAPGATPRKVSDAEFKAMPARERSSFMAGGGTVEN